MAGASRVTRLTWADHKPDAFVRVLAGVAAPLLTGFVLWLFQRASGSGIKTLYFIAREGEVLFQVAQVLNVRLDLGFDLRYLYVSRQAINPGVLVNPSRDDLEMALTHTSSFACGAYWNESVLLLNGFAMNSTRLVCRKVIGICRSVKRSEPR